MFDLTTCRFAFLDLETTGLSPWFGDRVCEVGVVLTEGRRIRESFQTLVNPERPLSPSAASTNRLTDAELAGAPRFSEIAASIAERLEDAVLVAHNAQFDLQFLDSEFRRLGRELQIPNLIDTLHLARGHYDLPSYTLGAIAAAFQVEKPGSHRALADALTCRAIFFAMMDQLAPRSRPLEEFIGLYNSPVWPQDGVQLPTELGEALESGRRLCLDYQDGDGQRTERWVTPVQVLGLSDYVYLKAFCHLRGAERHFRLDRILSFRVEA